MSENDKDGNRPIDTYIQQLGDIHRNNSSMLVEQLLNSSPEESDKHLKKYETIQKVNGDNEIKFEFDKEGKANVYLRQNKFKGFVEYVREKNRMTSSKRPVFKEFLDYLDKKIDNKEFYLLDGKKLEAIIDDFGKDNHEMIKTAVINNRKNLIEHIDKTDEELIMLGKGDRYIKFINETRDNAVEDLKKDIKMEMAQMFERVTLSQNKVTWNQIKI